jgi:hypothetical protein
MSNKSTETLRLSDDLIAVIRELIQLSLLTGTNIVDHMRGVRTEVINGAVVPTKEYVEAYNAYVEQLSKEAEEMQEAMQKAVATDVSQDDVS